jgi:hypothetical protein
VLEGHAAGLCLCRRDHECRGERGGHLLCMIVKSCYR